MGSFHDATCPPSWQLWALCQVRVVIRASQTNQWGIALRMSTILGHAWWFVLGLSWVVIWDLGSLICVCVQMFPSPF